MSQENVELVYQANDAFNRRDIEAFLGLLDPDVEIFSRIGELAGGGPHRGQDGVQSWWENLLHGCRGRERAPARPSRLQGICGSEAEALEAAGLRE